MMFPAVWPALPLALEFLLRLVLIGVILVRRRPNPPVTLAWIIVILAFPIIGFIAYLLVGEPRLGRSRIRRHAEIVERIESSAVMPASLGKAMRPGLPTRYRQIAALAEAVSRNPPMGGNALELLSDADLFIDRLVEDIDAAREHCHLLFYIYLSDASGRRVGESLIRAAERGVASRVLVDSVGSKDFLHSPLRDDMEQRGVRVVEAMPASVFRMAFSRVDLRNHRKIAVFDGRIGYTGSQNIASAAFAPKASYAPWVDVSVRMEGPAVRDLQMLFVEDWYLDTNESLEGLLAADSLVFADGVPVQIMGTGPNAYNVALRQLTQSAFHIASEELIVTTPYFVPDESTTVALCTAGRRGVDTQLVVPAHNDSPAVRIASRSYYEVLLDSGVKLYEFNGGLLHAKTITVDRDLAVVSTANLDRRSFELNFEVSMVVYDSDFASQLRFLQKSYINESTQVDPHAWGARGWPTKLWQNAVGVLSPLL
jgi:cardiolipin synthase A/B